MNKNMAVTIVAVVLLGMALVVYNEYTTTKGEEVASKLEVDTSEASSPKDLTSTQMPSEVQGAVKDEASNEPLIEPVTKPSENSMPKAAPKSVSQVVPAEQLDMTPPPANVEQWEDNAPLAPAAPSPIAKNTQAESSALKVPDQIEVQQKASSQEVGTKVEQEKSKTDPVAKLASANSSQAALSKPNVAVPAAKKDTKTSSKLGPKEIKKISISTIGDGVTVRIESMQTPAYKAMRLKSPERIVLDLNGDWKVKAPGVPKNEFVSNVRIGLQKNGTRIVIDLKKTPASIRYLKYGETGLDVRIR